MNKIIFGVIAAISAIGIIDVASASENKGIYIYGAAGQSNVSSQDNPEAFALSVGYQITPSWAIEGGYVDLGNVSGTNSSEKYNATQLTAVKYWNIPDMYGKSNFSILIKLGIAQTKTKLSITTPSFEYSQSKRGVTFGIGGNYDVDENWSVRVEGDSFDSGVTGINRIPVYLIGMSYKF